MCVLKCHSRHSQYSFEFAACLRANQAVCMRLIFERKVLRNRHKTIVVYHTTIEDLTNIFVENKYIEIEADHVHERRIVMLEFNNKILDDILV